MDIESVPNDFEVVYRFLTETEGGRRTGTPYQGYRCDWLYEEDNAAPPGKLQLWMIWPIFVDEDGIPLRNGTQVSPEGTARMLIVNDQLRESIHRQRLVAGVKGFFMESSKRVAEATVSKLVALANNRELSQERPL